MLYTIADTVRRKVNKRARDEWEREVDLLLQQVKSGPSMREALIGHDAKYIFEIKKMAPSNGGRPLDIDVVATATLYSDCGADAISVLTEEDFFAGSLADLQLISESVNRPLLRKDFVVDRLQIAEAKGYGASCVLLIVALLTNGQLKEFIDYATAIGIDTLVEVHSESELKRAVDAGATIIGVNNRNLRTMTIDLVGGARLLGKIPKECLRISESGIRTREDVMMMRDAGANALLIGSAIMRAGNMRAKIEELLVR